MKKEIIIAFGISILFLGVSITTSVAIDTTMKSSLPVSSGNTLYVGGSGEGNYTRIQDAINDSEDGDTVFVFNDSSPYNENIVIFKSISLIGENKNSTIIDGNGIFDVVKIYGKSTYICGFTIRNSGSENYDAGIYIRSSFCTISGNIINKNNGNGIFIYNSDSNSIKDNIICLNNDNSNRGLYSMYSNRNTIVNNSIIKNKKFSIHSLVGSNNTLSNNTWGIELSESHYNTILGNTISNNNWGIELGYSKNNTINNNNLSYNKLASLYLIGSDNNTLDSNVISKNKNGLLLDFSDNNRIICNIIELNYESGISIKGCWYNKISGNTINSNKGNGIFIGCLIFEYVLLSKFNLIKSNNIINNYCGILLSGYKEYAKNRFHFIIKNNFIDNNQDAYFTNSTINCWKQNYWNKSRYLPKIILGDMYIKDRYYNWLNFDWHPAKEPYNIEI